jgi:hypothetical protein
MCGAVRFGCLRVLFDQRFVPLTIVFHPFHYFLPICHSFTETNYLETYAEVPSDIYGNSAIDPAMANTYMQTRKFLMAMYELTEPEANTIITQGVDFAITQVVDGNWGAHSVIPKKIFEPYEGSAEPETPAIMLERQAPPMADLPLNSANVHWGFFSKELEPVLTVTSGQEVVVEMATHHACDDWDKMIAGDEGKGHRFLIVLCLASKSAVGLMNIFFLFCQ